MSRIYSTVECKRITQNILKFHQRCMRHDYRDYIRKISIRSKNALYAEVGKRLLQMYIFDEKLVYSTNS